MWVDNAQVIRWLKRQIREAKRSASSGEVAAYERTLKYVETSVARRRARIRRSWSE